MSVTSFRSVVTGLSLALAAAVVNGQQAQPPTFRSSVEVTPIDVTVVTGAGQPVNDLKPEDFQIRVDGKPRRIVSAEWVPLSRPQTGPPPSPPPEGYSSNENTTSGRLMLIVMDQPNIHSDRIMGIRTAVNAFIDRVQPSDPIAAVGLGHGAASTPFTTDHDRVKKALSLMSGQSDRWRAPKGMRQIEYWQDLAISTIEAVDILRGGGPTLDATVIRECQVWNFGGTPNPMPLTGEQLDICRQLVISDARAMGSAEIADREQTLLSLRSVLKGLAAIDAPKTLVLASEGFTMMDEPQSVIEIGSLAAAARTSIYVLKLDDQPFDMSQSGPSVVRAGDRQELAAGLDMIATTSRGALFNVIGDGAAALQRLERELSGYYLVGLESVPTDTDGKAHPINVQVSRRGVVVRARRELAFAGGAAALPRNPLEIVASTLGTPMMASGLPLRVATFSRRDPGGSKVQVMIHADVGADYISARDVTLGYIIRNSKDAVVASQTGQGRLAPVRIGVPSPLVYTVNASLEPGDYTLKLVVNEGDRVGSIEHPIHAALMDAGPVKLSELMIGGPLDARALPGPTIGYEVRFGSVQGYVEAYGPTGGLLTMKYEIAPGPDAPSLFGAVVPGRAEGDGRTVFSYALPVSELSPGQYYLRATLSSPDSPGVIVRRMARGFKVVPAAASAPAASAAAVPAPRAIALSVADQLFARRFRREDVSRRDTMDRFRETIATDGRRAFDEGAVSLAAGDDARAEQRFKSVLEAGLAGANNTAALAYLGATYAASGRDVDAVSVWQVALIDGAGFPQIYEWLGDALMRLRDVDQARAILEEASSRWPAETRFAKPLAIIHATAGNSSQALGMLERYLSDHKDDGEALSLGVEWMNTVHIAGAALKSRDEDLKLARTWADAYAAGNGPRADEVKRWMLSLESLR